MKTLSDERWQEIRSYIKAEQTLTSEYRRSMLIDVLQQHDHLAEQIKLLADYIMSKRPDDPAWSLGEGACAMAVEIMKREGDVEIAYKELQDHKNALVKENESLRERLVMYRKAAQNVIEICEFDNIVAQNADPQIMTRSEIEARNKERLAFPPFKIGK